MGKVIAFYLTISILFSIFGSLWGEYSYESYFYNLGRGLFWPVSMLRSYPELNGESPEKYRESYREVAGSHARPEGRRLFVETMGVLSLYMYVKGNENVNESDVKRLIGSRGGQQDFYKEMMENREIAKKVREYTDGMTLGDLVAQKEDLMDKIDKLLQERA